MKILCVGHSFVIDNNRRFWGIFSQKNNIQIDIISPEFWDSKLEKNLCFTPNPNTDFQTKIHVLPVIAKGNNSLFFFSPFQMLKILKNNQYDSIYIWQEAWALSTFFTIIIKLMTSKNRPTPVFLRVAENLYRKFPFPIRCLEKFNSRFISGFMCCDKTIKKVFHQKKIHNTCYYYPFPFDTEQFDYTKKTKTQNLLRIGYIGRVSQEKGLELLIRALDSLSFHFEFVVAGAGPLVEEVKSRPYTRYLGLLPHNQAQQFYQQIDVLVAPSQSTPHWVEQFGRVLVEAALTNCFVVGSDSGSIPGVLEAIGSPYVFPEKDDLALAKMMSEINEIYQSQNAEKFLNDQREMANQKFGQEAIEDLTIQIFKGTAPSIE